MTAFQPSGRSIANLKTCHRDLRRVVEALWADGIAVQVICGHRDKVEQNKAFLAGKSKLQWPKSKHNLFPARAVDLGKFPLDWNATNEWIELGRLVLSKAAELKIPIIWGGDWKTFRDYPHFELSQETSPGSGRGGSPSSKSAA